jgi:hypothetical protein
VDAAGFPVSGITPDELAKVIDRDLGKRGAVIKAAGIAAGETE